MREILIIKTNDVIYEQFIFLVRLFNNNEYKCGLY